MQPETSLSAGAQRLLASVRSLFGASNVTVTSTRRDPASNAGIAGASKTSQHLTGDAFDFQVKGLSPYQVQNVIAGSGLTFGQSIAEFGAGMSPRSHLSTGSKGETLVANNGRYSTRTIGADAIAQGRALADKAIAATAGEGRKTLESWLGKGIGGAISNGLEAGGNALQEPAKALGLDGSQWDGLIKRGSLIVFGLLLIAASLIMLGKGAVVKTALKSVPGI